MEPIKSNIVNTDALFVNNYNASKQRSLKIDSLLEQVMNRYTDGAVIKHLERGKLTARERISKLVDVGSTFLELSALAANGAYNHAFPSAGIITGIGVVMNQLCVVVANDATVKGGTYIHETIKKHLRALEIALENRIPAVFLVDSGGVYLPNHTEVFPDRDHFGRIFYLQSQLSAASIPQIAVVMGSCTAGGAYVPAMSDECIIVRNQGTIFLAGPPLVKAATGEVVTPEELGGAEVHTAISGVADHIADDDAHAIEICRDIFGTLPAMKLPLEQLPNAYEQPLYASDEIHGLIPEDSKQPVDIHEIIARITDGSRFHEFKANYGKTLVTGFATIKGITVGIIANNGILFSESALKGTHFIELCNHRHIPIVFLQNISGFIVGKTSEHGGIAKDGAKMVHAVATANVPKITIIIGGSFGAGNYAMAGRAYSPAFLFMWPNARIGVMGGEQAAGVLTTLKMQNNVNQSPESQAKLRQELIEQYNNESSALYSTSRIWDDGIIHPHETRDILALTLTVVKQRNKMLPKNGVYRM